MRALTALRVTPLSLTGFASAHKRFRLGTRKPRATRLQFRLSAPARVTLVFARQRKGRHSRFVRAGAISVNAKAGAGALRFQGRLPNGKSLRPGSYRVTATVGCGSVVRVAEVADGGVAEVDVRGE